MLCLYKVEPGRLDYYLSVTATESKSPFFERDGYWTAPGGVVSTEAKVARQQLVDVALGRELTTGRSLNPYQSRVRYCAIDAMFAAPKTVSVLHALGDHDVRSAIEASHRQSVHDVMDFVARKLIVVRRSPKIEPSGAERISMRGSTLGQAVFEHRTSRSSDPHLHSHVLVPNVATVEGNRWSAFDMRPIYVHSGLLGSLYRASLRRYLSVAAGVKWREIRPGWYDVAGLSPPMISAFSHRSNEILTEMTRQGFTSSKAAAITSARLRAKRDTTMSYDELRDRWQQRAYRVGISPSRIREMTDARPLDSAERERHRREVVRVVSRVGGAQTYSATLRSVTDQLREGVYVGEAETEIGLAVLRGEIDAPTDLWPFGPRGEHRPGPKRTLGELGEWSVRDIGLAGPTCRQYGVHPRSDDFALSL